MQSNILAVDTSSKVLSVAIIQGSGDSFEANLDGTPKHSEHLIGLIEQGLKSLALKKTDLDQFVWGLGPGSFTGLRIGMAALKGFTLGFKKRSYGVSSLDLIALGSSLTEGELAVCVDARRERIYLAIYRFENKKVVKILQDSLFSLDELIGKLKPGTFVTGDALLTYGKQIESQMERKVYFLNPAFWYPRASAFVRLQRECRAWMKPVTLRTMTPRYLRSSEAEEKRKSRDRK